MVVLRKLGHVRIDDRSLLICILLCSVIDLLRVLKRYHRSAIDMNLLMETYRAAMAFAEKQFQYKTSKMVKNMKIESSLIWRLSKIRQIISINSKHFYYFYIFFYNLFIQLSIIIWDATDAPLIEGLGAGKGAGVIDHAVGDKTGWFLDEDITSYTFWTS